MQLSELLGRQVLDDDARRVGTVIDVRLAVGGNLSDNPPAPTLFGLLVSPRTTSSYLGYERTDARQPVVMSALLRWRHRGTFLVLWSDVERLDTEAVMLRKGYCRYSPILHESH